ncbi:unnamed protein product, partial [marine sediment metagenome]
NPGVATGVVAGEKIELTYGDSLRVNVSFGYRGLAGKATLHGAIGNHHTFPTDWFDDICEGEDSIDLPESLTEFTPCTASVDVGVTSALDPGTYDLRVKFPDYLEAGQPTEDNVIDIVGIKPTFELIQHHISHFAYIYDGDVEVTTATFKTDPFTPSAWAAKKFADALESEFRKVGGKVLEVKVSVDKTPLLWTDYRIEVIGTPLGEGVAATAGIAAIHIPIAITVLIIALAIIA